MLPFVIYAVSKMSYIGRFAPSPSGHLHFGSLIAAVGSYLQAKSQLGKWLVRIEDIDPPREQPGAANAILRTLERYHLFWDDEVVYQSQRTARYEEILSELFKQQQVYYCHCTRAQIQAAGSFYPGTCRDHHVPANHAAIRLKVDSGCSHFNDQILGHIQVDHDLSQEDFILKRRDGLFAYNLAVVIDDHDSGITEIVRGADLLEPTVRQITLFETLGWSAPQWMHLPLAIQSNGLKLSKQNHAPAIDDLPVMETLVQVLQFLGQALPQDVVDMTPTELLQYAIQHWDIHLIPKQSQHSQPFAIVTSTD